MLNAYIGTISRNGLNVLHVEGADSLRRLRRSAGDGIGFWAVIPESDAQIVRFLLSEGESDSALRFLDRSARDAGRLIPNR